MWAQLEPLGFVRVLAPLHVGPRFHLYRVRWRGEDGCLKTPAPAPAPASLLSTHTRAWRGSEYFETGKTAPIDPGAQALGELLEAEAAAIDRTEGAWNHRTLGLGRWVRPLEEAESAPALPALLLPLHDAVPLAELPAAERGDLLLRMLPALWNALCGRPHGDLSESNLLIARDRSRFHVIDPSGSATDVLENGDDRSTVWSRDVTTRFVTTPANYPILPPSVGPVSGDLQSALDGLIGQWRAPFPGHRELANTPPAPSGPSRPGAADLLALGILTWRALTGEEPFLGPGRLLERPAWLGEHPAWSYFPHVSPGEVLPAWERVRDTLPAWLDGILSGPRVPTPQRALLRALLRLEVSDVEELSRLVRGR